MGHLLAVYGFVNHFRGPKNKLLRKEVRYCSIWNIAILEVSLTIGLKSIDGSKKPNMRGA